MKKGIIILFVIAVLSVMSASVSEAAVFIADSPFSLDFLQIITNFNVFGDHAVMSFNSIDNSAFAVILDLDGFPVQSASTFGFAFLFADFFANRIDIYGSNTGFANDWFFVTSVFF